NVVLYGGSGGNRVFVYSTGASTSTWVNAGTGDDSVTVASGPPNANRLDDIAGPLSIDGQGPDNSNSIVLDDSGKQGPFNYCITPTSVTRAGIATVTTLNFKNWTLRQAFLAAVPAGGNFIAVTGFLPDTNLTIDGPGNGLVALGNDNNLLDDLHGNI